MHVSLTVISPKYFFLNIHHSPVDSRFDYKLADSIQFSLSNIIPHNLMGSWGATIIFRGKFYKLNGIK